MTVKELIEQLSKFNPESLIQMEDLFDNYYLPSKVYQCPYNSRIVTIFIGESDDKEEQ